MFTRMRRGPSSCARKYIAVISAPFEEAYAIDRVPNYLFNIGRVYEEKGDIRSAVDYYQRFVKEPGVEIEARDLALQRLRVLKGVLQETDPEAKDRPEPDEARPAGKAANDRRLEPAQRQLGGPVRRPLREADEQLARAQQGAGLEGLELGPSRLAVHAGLATVARSGESGGRANRTIMAHAPPRCTRVLRPRGRM